MISKQVKSSSDNAYLVIPQDSDDLFLLRRIVKNGDYVIADTSRVIKEVKQYARPNKGERIKVRVSVLVDKINLDDVIDRLRISGMITNTNNELVPRGTHHSLTIRIGDSIIIDKGRKWKDIEINNLMKSADNNSSFLLVAIDTQEAAVAKVTGTHLKSIPNIYSGQSGKRYQRVAKNDPNIEVFFEDIFKVIMTVLPGEDETLKILILGPGETKRRFFNLLVEKHFVEKDRLIIVEGVDVAGEDGIFVFLRSPLVKDTVGTSKIAIVSSILDKIMQLVRKGETKYAMGISEVHNAALVKAIEYLVFSDSIFKTADENEILNLLDLVEGYGAKTYAVDSSTDIGLRISSIGGIVALLRYAIS
jgi:protein pelota